MQIQGDAVLWGEFQVGELGKVTTAPGDKVAKHVTVQTCTYQLAPVPGGDLLIPTLSGIVGVERKRTDNLATSWWSGEMSEQLGVMLQHYDHVVLAIEGTGLLMYLERFGDPDDIYYRLTEDLITLQEAGVRVIYTNDIKGTGHLAGKLMERYNRTAHGALDRSRPQDSSVYRRVVMSIPDWGQKTATSALREIGLPIAVFNADPKTLLAVPGVSPRRLQNLFQALGRRIHGKVHGIWTRQRRGA